MDDWPYSLKELTAAKEILYRAMSFLDVVKRYSREISPILHTDFSHKCSCPFHGDGKERTPSFYFSERNKSFHCFGCGIHGNLFTFLSVVEGKPWEFIVRDFLSESSITDKDISEVKQGEISFIDNSDIYMQMGVTLRDYLATFKRKVGYYAEFKWVEWIFARVDTRFDEGEMSPDEARSFQMQIDREIFRRKRNATYEK